jgi:hypothetical protein
MCKILHNHVVSVCIFHVSTDLYSGCYKLQASVLGHQPKNAGRHILRVPVEVIYI